MDISKSFLKQFLAIIVFIATFGFATTINVPSDQTTIQAGIDAASDGDTVLVAAGTYVENIMWPNVPNIHLISESGPEQTIIDGSLSGSVIDFGDGQSWGSIYIEGFTVKNGTANSGAGLRISFPSSSEHSLTMNELIIENNYSSSGGAMWVSPSYGIIRLNSSIVRNNTGTAIWGNGLNSASFEIVNTLIYNNEGGAYGYGNFDAGNGLKVINCTVVNNIGSGPNGGAFALNNGNLEIVNSIIHNNQPTDITTTGSFGNINVNNSLLTNDEDSVTVFYPSDAIQFDWSENTYGVSPGFVEYDNNNFHLSDYSQIIGAGTTTGAPTTDIEGNPRPNPAGTNPDIGAYENPYGVPQYQPQVVNVPTDYSTIQAALTAANATDTVLVQPGTYTENIIWPETNGIKLISSGDSSNTIIDGGEVSSVIYMNPQTATIDTTTLIQGFKITNGGSVGYGGGICIIGASAKIKGNIVANNTAYYKGGGLYNSGLSLICEYSIISGNAVSQGNNSSSDGGGGIYNEGNAALFSNLKIFNNSSADNGGGIQNYGNSCLLDNLWINSNTTASGGGGINYNSSSFILKNSIVTNNSAGHSGGGLSTAQSGSFINVIISNNSALDGAGIRIGSGGSFDNVSITNNSASRSGGAAYCAGNITINNSKILSNTVNGNPGRGGGLYLHQGSITLSNTVIFNNSSSDYGGGIFNSVMSANYSNVLFFENEAQLGGALYNPYEEGSNTLSNVTLFNNSASNDYNGIYNSSGTVSIENSNFINNGNALYNENSLEYVSATNNYWGHTSGPYHPSQNLSGAGDSVNALVNVDPWLTTPNTDTPISPPKNVIKRLSGSNVILTWDANPESDLAGYKIHYGNFTGYSYSTNTDVGNVTTHTLSGVSIDSSISVTAYDGNANGTDDQVEGYQSWFTAASPPPDPATNLTSSYAGATSIDLSWTASTSGNISKYLIYRSTSANATTLVDSTSGATTYADTDLTHGLTYYYRAKAVDSDGIKSDYSNETSTLLATKIGVPGDYSSIQVGLTAAGTNDTVYVQPGTYTENIIWPETNGIKLISAGDSSNTIIDGGGVSSVIYMNPQSATIDTTTLIQGFKITNGGNFQNGSGIYINNSDIKLIGLFLTDNQDVSLYVSNSDNIIINNTSINGNYGGNEWNSIVFAIYFENNDSVVINNSQITNNLGGSWFGNTSSLLITNTSYMYNLFPLRVTSCSDLEISHCTFNYNQNAEGDGGGLICFNSTGRINNSSISYNTVNGNSSGGTREGGGAWLSGSIQLLNSEIRGNKIITSGASQGKGGGLYITGGVTIDSSVIVSNEATINSGICWSGGGGICIQGTATVSNSKIINNTSNGNGGGILVSSTGSQVEISKSIFSGNIATGNGGGISNRGTLNAVSLTISKNNGFNGGAIFTCDGTLDLVNGTIYSNTSDGVGSSVYVDDGTITMSYSNFSNENLSVNNSTSNWITLVNNYWGNPSGPYHPSQNASGEGDSVNTFVNVDPWLTEPNTDAPPIPAQNTTVTGTGNDFISLSWDASEIGDLAGYKLYYDSDSSGYPYTNSVDIGTDTSYTLSSLTLGTAYYLAVTTYDTDGNESWYSNEVTGVTRVMQAQSLNIGGNEDLQHMVSHTPSITFNYYDSMGETQTSYQVQVSSDSLFSSADMWDSGEVTSSDTAVTYAGTTLEDGTTYYLRVKVGAGTFYSEWSSLTFRMNTEPTTPVLLAPINDQVSGTPVVLNVLNGSDAESDVITYSFNVYSDVALTTKLDSATTVTEGTDTTSWQVTATLPDNGQYFWTVSTNDGYEESAVSDTASFLLNIANDAPATFALTYPADTSEVTTTLPTLLWQASADPDPIDTVRYMVQFGSTILDLETFYTNTMTSYQFIIELEDNTDYFWRVIAEDLNGASTENTGGYHSFRVNTANDLPGDFALISPENESIVTDLTPTLYWEIPVDPDDRSRSIVSYHVYLDTSLTGTIPDTVSTNSYTASNLLEDALYYWKVVAVDNDGGTKESSTWSFWTNSENSVPSPFTLLTPTVGEETGLTPTFSWTASSDADLYDVLGYTLSYGSDPTSLTDVSTNSELTYTPETDLTDNTDYVWQVTATDQSGATYITALQSFTVNSANDDPGVFFLISPDSGSVVLELPPLLVWSPTTDLDGDSVLFDIQLNGTSIGMTHHNYFFVDDLAEDMTYTWSVTAMDNNGGSTQSGTWSFIVNTENVPPTSFALLSPETETVFNTQSVFFEWETSSDPDPMDSVTYGLDVHTDTTHMHFEINTTSFTSEAFMDNRVYHWSVTAHDMNGGVTENIGGPRMFVINVENDPPTASTLVAPLNESIQTDLTPNFYWTEADDPDPLDHVSYTLNWWGTGNMDIQSIDTDSNSFTPEDNLTDNSQFGWMVTANDMHGAESSSDSSYFYTDAFPEPPANFATVAPENNAEGIATEVEFAWNETHDPDPVEEIHYQLVYATDWADSSTYVYSDLLEDTSLTVTLDDNSQYYWIVVATDTDGFMVGSNDNTPNTMVVGTLSIDGADIPEVFALHQNYPNPFNPTTKIRYDLPEDALVAINIYDLMGRSIKSLVKSNQSAGYRSIQWNATNNLGEPVSAGMYLYTIQAGKFRQTKKMVLLK